MNISEIETTIRRLRQRIFDVPDNSPEQEEIGQEIERLKLLAMPFWNARNADAQSRRMSVYLMD